MPDIVHLHPMTVHFPIALLIAGVLIEIVGVLLGKEILITVGKWNMILGTAALVVVVATGLLAEDAVEHSEEAHAVMSRHKNVGIAVLVLFGSLAIVRSVIKEKSRSTRHYVLLAVAVVGVLVMIYGALLGARLVYEHGVAVSAPALEHDEHQHDQNVPTQETEEGHTHGAHEH